MTDISVIGEAFANCQLSGGILNFPQMSPQVLSDLYKKFSEDLLNCQIPHYRVVGVWHSWDDKHAKSVFRSNDIYGMSLIELSMKLRYLIPMHNGGNNPDKGCFYGVNEEINNLKEFDNAFGPDNGKGYDKRTSNILMLPSTEIGSLMCDTSYGDPEQYNTCITTSNCWYTQYSAIEELEFPQVLIPNKYISELKDASMGSACTVMFIKKGIGKLTFKETQRLFAENVENVMPCDVVYDLSPFFTCRIPVGGETHLNFVYLEEINEVVLEDILKSYGRWLLEQ